MESSCLKCYFYKTLLYLNLNNEEKRFVLFFVKMFSLAENNRRENCGLDIPNPYCEVRNRFWTTAGEQPGDIISDVQKGRRVGGVFYQTPFLKWPSQGGSAQAADYAQPEERPFHLVGVRFNLICIYVQFTTLRLLYHKMDHFCIILIWDWISQWISLTICAHL